MEKRMSKVRGFPEHPACLSTGFKGLDYAIGGLRAGSITCFGSAPCRCREFVLCELALRAAESGINVLFLSLEQRSQRVENVFLALRSGVDPGGIAAYSLRKPSTEAAFGFDEHCAEPTEAQLKRMRLAREHMSDLPLKITDSPVQTLDDVRLSAENMRVGIGPEADMLVVINYLKLIPDYFDVYFDVGGMGSVGKDPSDTTRRIWDLKSEFARLSFELRAISLGCNAPVVTSDWVSRRSRYHDLSTVEDYDFSYGLVKGAFFVDQDCDVLVSLDEVVSYESDAVVDVKMRILKNSYGGLLPVTIELPAPFLETEQIGCTIQGYGML